MTHLSELARLQAGQAAATAADGTGLTFAQLDDESRRLAALLEARGLQPGDTVAILLENIPRYLSAAWGALRAGLRIVPVNWHLSAAEAVYIAGDSGARALITSATLAPLASEIAASGPVLEARLMCGPAAGFEDLDAALAASSPERPAEEPGGQVMFYSSGTTGGPKGIKRTLPPEPFGSAQMLETLLSALYGFGPDTVYLCTGPLYHAAPLGWSLGAQGLGGQVVVMPRFDAEACLAMIEQFRVTHVQFVPTMFVRLLKLAPEVRARYDLSSLRRVVHAAAPCPVEVKRAIIEWLGPIVDEYYAASEGNCYFAIGSEEWLAHPGSVGKALLGTPHILDDDGTEVGRARWARSGSRARGCSSTTTTRRRRRVQRPGLEHARRPGPGRRRRLPVPVGPADRPDHHRRRQRLPEGDRGRAGHAPRSRRRRRHRAARRGDGPGDPRRRPASRGVTGGPELEQELSSTARGSSRVQAAPARRLRHRAAAGPSGKILRRLVRDTYLEGAAGTGAAGG